MCDRRLLARTMWNRLGCRAGGVSRAQMDAFWAGVQSLPPAAVPALQQLCADGASPTSLLEWLLRYPECNALTCAATDVITSRDAACAYEQGGYPLVYTD